MKKLIPLIPLLAIIATLSWQETSGNYRICHYNAMGSEYVITMRVTDTCELTIEV